MGHPWNPPHITALSYSEGLRRTLNWFPIMPRDANLSDNHAPDRCSFFPAGWGVTLEKFLGTWEYFLRVVFPRKKKNPHLYWNILVCVAMQGHSSSSRSPVVTFQWPVVGRGARLGVAQCEAKFFCRRMFILLLFEAIVPEKKLLCDILPSFCVVFCFNN